MISLLLLLPFLFALLSISWSYSQSINLLILCQIWEKIIKKQTLPFGGGGRGDHKKLTL